MLIPVNRERMGRVGSKSGLCNRYRSRTMLVDRNRERGRCRSYPSGSSGKQKTTHGEMMTRELRSLLLGVVAAIGVSGAASRRATIPTSW